MPDKDWYVVQLIGFAVVLILGTALGYEMAAAQSGKAPDNDHDTPFVQFKCTASSDCPNVEPSILVDSATPPAILPSSSPCTKEEDFATPEPSVAYYRARINISSPHFIDIAKANDGSIGVVPSSSTGLRKAVKALKLTGSSYQALDLVLTERRCTKFGKGSIYRETQQQLVIPAIFPIRQSGSDNYIAHTKVETHRATRPAPALSPMPRPSPSS